MTDEYHRELAEYDPGDGRPVNWASRRRAMRIIVVIALVALVLPGVLVTVSTQISTADAACRVVVIAGAPEAVGSVARFELAGGDGPGWYCYAQLYGGDEILLRSIGLIPGLSPQPVEAPGQQA